MSHSWSTVFGQALPKHGPPDPTGTRPLARHWWLVGAGRTASGKVLRARPLARYSAQRPWARVRRNGFWSGMGRSGFGLGCDATASGQGRAFFYPTVGARHLARRCPNLDRSPTSQDARLQGFQGRTPAPPDPTGTRPLARYWWLVGAGRTASGQVLRARLLARYVTARVGPGYGVSLHPTCGARPLARCCPNMDRGCVRIAAQERDGNIDDNDVHIKWMDVDHGLWPGKGQHLLG